MKKSIKFGTIGFIVIIAALVGLFGSCQLFNNLFGLNVGATERVNLFRADLTAGSYTNLYTHFYDGVTAEYETMKSQSYWDNRPFNSNDYVGITGLSDPSTNSAGDTATITATLQSASDYNITFTLKQDGNGDFYITVIDFESAYDAFDVRFLGR